MDGACVTYGEEKKNAYWILVGNREGNRPTGVPGHREGGNTKI